MPSGARTIELGLPLIWPIIQSPTASKYFARSSLVTGLPAPAPGLGPLSVFELTPPIPSADWPPAFAGRDPFDLMAARFAAAAAAGRAISVITGRSAITSPAGLSSRRP